MSRHSPALMRANEAVALPSPARKNKKGQEIRISKLAREACELLASGDVKTIKEAAEKLNCSRTHLSTMMQRPDVNDYLVQAAKRKITSATLRAAHVKTGLLEAFDEAVRNKVATEVLAIAGIAAPKQGNSINISNNVTVSAGYILNATGKPEAEIRPLIDASHDVDAT